MKTREERVEEFEKGAKIIKAAIGMAMRLLDNITEEEEEEETVNLRISYETEREKVITIPQSILCGPQGGTLYMDIERGYAISKREDGPLAGKAFELNDMFNWQLGKDDEGVVCLVPLKKDVKRM